MTERRTKRSSAAVEEPVVAEAAEMDETAVETAEAVADVAAEAPVAAADVAAEAPAAAAEPVIAASEVAEATDAAPEATAAPEPAEAAPQPTAETPAATDEAPERVAEEPVADAPEPAAERPAVADEPVADDALEPAAEPVAEDAPVPAAEPAQDEAPPIAAAVAEPAEEPAAPERPKSRAAAPAAPRPSGPRGLQVRYRSEIIPALMKQFEYANPNMVPGLDKIVVNIGIGEALTNAKAIDAASGDLTMITGQKPIVMKARRSIAQFKIREGNPIGLKVTLRGQRMWDFLERLTMLALPRIRDFRGTPSRSFDGRGNYTLGLREQIAFPEIDYDKVDRLRGLEVSIVTTAKSDEESKRLLELLGMPFAG
jgi:large subunit ribosomal protein L5